MKIAIASDHRGFPLKAQLIAHLHGAGHGVADLGIESIQPTDYPEIAENCALAVTKGQVDFGILIGGSGIGMGISANKIHGIRAAVCGDELSVELARRHVNANVLCLGADLLAVTLAKRIAEIFLTTDFERGRHSRRLEQIRRLENNAYLDVVASPR